MALAPSINGSDQEERRAFIREKYPCIADCDACGICAAFHGKDGERAFAPYIRGEAEYAEVAASLRR